MDDRLVAKLLLLVLPAIYFGVRLGLADRAWVRRLGLAVLLLAVLPSVPWGGADLAYLKRLTLLVALGAALLLAARRLTGGGDSAGHRAAVTALAGLSVLVYLNFFGFHGGGKFIHYHDVAHYQLGSKYFGELGYRQLYAAMLAAEAELHGSLPAPKARDLASLEVLPATALLAAGEEARAGFTAERWSEFRRDVEVFHRGMGGGYPSIFMDHGFNASPVWAMLGGAVARLVPAGSERGVLLLSLLDSALLAAAFAAVGWAFGRRVVPIAALYFTVVFGASFFWIGGAFLRFLWFFAVVVAACCLHRKRYAAAGALLGLATGLRVFPVLLMVPLAFKGAALVLRGSPRARRYLVLGGAYLGTLALLVALTGFLPRGWAHWSEFTENTSQHLGIVSPNVVSLTQILALPESQAAVTWEEFRALKQRRARIFRAQLLLVLVPLLGLVAVLSRWQTDLGALALGLPLLFVGLNLAAYYWVVLLLLVLLCRNHPGRLAMIFGAEAVVYCLTLFVDRQAALFAERGIALCVLFAVLFLPLLRRETRLARRDRPEEAAP